MATMETSLFSDDDRCSYHELLNKLLGSITEPLKSSRYIDWDLVEADLGVVLPATFKLASSILPAGFLGSGITWTSPDTNCPEFRFDRQRLTGYADLIGKSAEFPLYPVVPGYLVFATTSWRIDLAFWVEKSAPGNNHCQPLVVLIECITGEHEETGIEIDEFLYRVISNNPPLKGSLSGRFHEGFFSNRNFPLFHPVDK